MCGLYCVLQCIFSIVYTTALLFLARRGMWAALWTLYWYMVWVIGKVSWEKVWKFFDNFDTFFRKVFVWALNIYILDIMCMPYFYSWLIFAVICRKKHFMLMYWKIFVVIYGSEALFIYISKYLVWVAETTFARGYVNIWGNIYYDIWEIFAEIRRARGVQSAPNWW